MVAGKRSSRAGVVVEPVVRLRPAAGGGRVPATRVAEVQRARILAAAVGIASELGYGAMSTARVSARAGVSRKTFYELFENREDCFLAVFDEAVDRATVVAQRAALKQGIWREQVRAGLRALLGFVGDEPGLGALLIVDALGAGPRVLERRAQGLAILSKIVDQGRGEVKTGGGPPSLTAEGVVGAVLSVLHGRLLEQHPGSVTDLLNPLMGMIVLPYLGQGAAAKELERSAPRVPRTPRRTPRGAVGHPLQGLEMRLTYRTLRVVSAISEQPGVCNREVAERAGVADQGQISKLLTRLERLGLAENTGDGQVKGEPNAWRLTPKGRRLAQSIATHADGHMEAA